MLYVVGGSLPKTDFLTKIDKVIVLTTVSLAVTGVASLILVHVHKSVGVDQARMWNWAIEITLLAVYVIANVWIFGPASFKQMRTASSLRTKSHNADVDLEKGKLRPTVKSGYSYWTLKELPRKG